MGYNKDLIYLKGLINKGKTLLEKCESVKGGDFTNSREYERIGAAWYAQVIEFLSTRFGPNSFQVKKFANYFGVYKSQNYLGEYGGVTLFVKEDVQKALGHLEGLYNSFAAGYLKRINPFFRLLYKIWLEIKELLSMILKILTQK